MAKEFKICNNCGTKVNKAYIRCPRCGSHSLIMTTNTSVKYKAWKICDNCGENVEAYYSVCPYCNSTSLTIKESSELPYFSPLKSVRLSSSPGEVKTCPSCGRQIGTEVFKCPFCHNLVYERISEMENQDEIVEIKNYALSENIKHKLFFRNYDGDIHVFSRSKFLTVLAFVVFFICSVPFSTNVFASAIVSLILAVPVYLLGLLGRSLYETETVRYIRMRNRDDNLLRNIAHFLFYWHDEETDVYTLSKTKTISLLMYALFAGYLAAYSPSLLGCLIFGLFAFIPAFLIGIYLHFAYPGKKPKVEKDAKPQIAPQKESEPKAIPEREVKPKAKSSPIKSVYGNYEVESDKLKSEFDVKEENIRMLIDKRFPAPQITNDKFNAVVDECHEVFYHRADIISTLIASSTYYSSRMEDEIYSNILALKEINGKMDTLSDELLINISESENDDVQDLIEEIDRLTDSVRDYN